MLIQQAIAVAIGCLHAHVPAAAARLHVPGLNVAIVRRDSTATIWSYGPGIDSTTIFQAASLSKPVFAYAVQQQHVVDLDAPLPFGGATPRMILEHTAGFPRPPRAQATAPAFPPGTRWSYSGAGYIYLQHIVEHKTGRPLAQWIRDVALVPLGMSRSSFVSTGVETVGHDRAGKPMPAEPDTVGFAAFSLRTTVGDYARFLEAVLRSGGPKPAVVADSALGLSWAPGWGIEPSGTLFHPGSNPGFKNLVLGDPADSSGIVILTNGDNGLELAPTVVSCIDGRPHPMFRFWLLHPDD